MYLVNLASYFPSCTDGRWSHLERNANKKRGSFRQYTMTNTQSWAYIHIYMVVESERKVDICSGYLLPTPLWDQPSMM
jgi:hypothetical protein